MIHSDEVSRMLLEITLGKEPAVPDDEEHAEMRAQLQKECDQIRADGYEVDIQFEIPSLDDQEAP